MTKELEDHMEDQKTDFMADGMTEQEAEEAAVTEMGDPVDVGVQMDGIHKPKMPWGMIALIVVISGIGIFIQGMLDASVQGISIEKFPLGNIFVQKSVLYYMIGIIIMIGVCYLDYTWIARHAKKLAIAMYVGVKLMMAGWGVMINGSKNFIYVLGISINVSLLLYLVIPLYCAILYAYRGKGYRALLQSALWMIPPFFIAQYIPSAYTSVTLLLVFLVILAVAVYKDWFQVSKKLVLGGIGTFALMFPVIAGMLAWTLGAEYQRARIQAMLDLSAFEEGYQALALRKLLGGSKFIGQNDTFATDFQVLPVNHEYVLAYVTSYYGILAAVLLVALLGFLVFRFMKISMKQKNHVGMLMGVGCSTVLAFQIIFYILSNTGVSLFGDRYCPLLNRGGTGTIVTYVLLGLMLSICRYQNVLPEHVNVTKEATKTGSLLSQK